MTATSATAGLSHNFLSSFGGGETPGGGFGFISSLAVDNSKGPSKGDVYVYETNLSNEAGTVDKLDAGGKYSGVQITGAQTPQGKLSPTPTLSKVGAIAVDNSSSVNQGDLYVLDTGHKVVDKFSESGSYICQITGTATPSTSECDGGAGSETPNESMQPTGVAVDSVGNVYVSDAAHQAIDEFSADGAYVRQLVDPHITKPTALAIDASDDLYVLNFKQNVAELNSSGAFVAVIDESSPSSENEPSALAVDRLADRVYVVDSKPLSEIAEYDATDKLLDVFGEGLFEQSSRLKEKVLGLATDDATGELYAAEEIIAPGGKVDVFGPDVVLPTVTTGAASEVGQTGATVNGVADPDTAEGGGSITACEFEYGTGKGYGETAPCEPAPPYAALSDVHAGLSGLLPDTVYHFRLDATDASGTSRGKDATFTTSGPPTVTAEASSNIVISTGSVQAQLDPFGIDTKCHVQYVDEEAFRGSGYEHAVTVPCAQEEVGAGFGPSEVSASLSGLAIATVYHYRFVATSAAAPDGVDGADQTFATFGIASFSLAVLSFNEAMQSLEAYAQAGGHPYELTTSVSFNTTNIPGVGPNLAEANPKDVIVELPPGLIGNPEATPKCAPYNVAHADCSGASQVGILKVLTAGGQEHEAPIYNVEPPVGVPAQFGARFNGFVTAHIDATIRTGSDYGITTSSLYMSAAEGLTGASVTLWGIPSDPRHDQERFCPAVGKIDEEGPCGERGETVPFLTDPTSCVGVRQASVHVDSWQAPGSFVTASSDMAAIAGCGELAFKPAIAVEPAHDSTDSPSGLTLQLTVPQNQGSKGLATAEVKSLSVLLPPGVVLNPSAANGRVACTPAQIALSSAGPPDCPDGSEIGTAEAVSALVDHPLKGGLYIAAQHENPFGSLYAMYLTIDDPQTGVVVKLAGEVTADPLSGRLRTTFDESPQLLFERLRIRLFDGPRAILATPRSCGSYTAGAVLEPWSHDPADGEQAGTADAESFSTFTLASGPQGAPCGAPGFAPSFTAGTTNDDAGAFSAFVLDLTRKDGEQRLSSVALNMPAGLSGEVSSVMLCPEPQASTGDCPAASKIGHVEVSAGVGNDPIVLPQAGKPEDPVYLTGAYGGAPFGLSVVVPAEAGPFNLDEGGRPIVVRARVDVAPRTAQVTVLSDPMPTILQGVPLDVRSIVVHIDRPDFIFNPTGCNPANVSGTIGSSEGGSEGVSSRFQAAGCGALPFHPSFVVSTQGRTSKADGASLDVKVKSPVGSANVREVHVSVPKQLPSRLETLKLACVDHVFEINPAACPAASAVGTASAVTPILAGSVTGPAYLVSHGGAEFPDLEIVLQGQGVTLILDGKTNIKNDITTSTFESLPDAPVRSFELKLPEGPRSVLGAPGGKLCSETLVMPTTMRGQNGAVTRQSTKLKVTGCKPAIEVLRHRVSGAVASIVAKVPAAGVLTAEGSGLSRAVRRFARAGQDRLVLRLTKVERGFLAQHPGRRLRARVALRFTPRRGRRLTAEVTLLIG
ncbi:MAG TPA: hypothetical protein VFW38_03085 [Solirubrobacteraceae bacterium]|nr:hypothetical protein [Solirubrobacteraceae bacterium]